MQNFRNINLHKILIFPERNTTYSFRTSLDISECREDIFEVSLDKKASLKFWRQRKSSQSSYSYTYSYIHIHVYSYSCAYTYSYIHILMNTHTYTNNHPSLNYCFLQGTYKYIANMLAFATNVQAQLQVCKMTSTLFISQ